MSKTAFAILIGLTLCAPPILGLAGMSPPTGAPRLVLFPPWEDGAALVEKAGGSPVGPEQAPMGILAFAADGAAFDRRLREIGAWAIVDGTVLARLCGLQTTEYSEGKEL
ncbi:hypothetical protein [Cognatishimia sp. F0-27]|uniref:hypothetical protein n=1 Tax=Cognatishimia sp. F0-27 TaxID=2816855 RepID=UPI001D0CDA41|nr:hypothetical protein [Cognatishimia sp. F0-27]MCC1493706.1 hypothetical protein [Cognatishimia sp. F0-27]